MFPRFNLAAAVLALALFAYAQYQGWNMFENQASREGQHGSSGRVYHK